MCFRQYETNAILRQYPVEPEAAVNYIFTRSYVPGYSKIYVKCYAVFSQNSAAFCPLKGEFVHEKNILQKNQCLYIGADFFTIQKEKSLQSPVLRHIWKEEHFAGQAKAEKFYPK